MYLAWASRACLVASCGGACRVDHPYPSSVVACLCNNNHNNNNNNHHNSNNNSNNNNNHTNREG